MAKKDRRKANVDWNATIDALQQFVRVLEAADERSRHAAICWLADKYLGVNVYDRARREGAKSEQGT
jgi:hypothetical protein